MIQTYSLSRLGNTHKLSENFTLGEFACNDGSDEVKVSEELVQVLERIRSYVRLRINKDAVVIITSGYRSPEWNRHVKGAPSSRHCVGDAADIKVSYRVGNKLQFVEPNDLYQALDTGRVTGNPFVGGLGLYDSWLHIDTRPANARWDERKKK